MLDFQRIRVVDDRLGPVGFAGELGPAADDVHFRDGLSGGQQGLRASNDFGEESLEKFGLASQRLFVGSQDLALLGPQLFGGEALGVHHGLLPDIIGRHRGEIGLGDLDGVAEGAVVADLQGLDAGPVLFITLELSDPALAIGSERTKAIEFDVETCAQCPALAEVDGEFVA